MTALRRALGIQVGGLLLAALFVAWLARTFPVLDFITRAHERITALDAWGAALHPLLFALCNLLLLPGGILAIGGGLFFGLWWGWALNLAGTLLGAAGAFGLSRGLVRGWVARRFLTQRRWAALDEAIAREGPRIIFLSQLCPLFPTSLLAYLYGATSIRFGTCMAWVALGQAPGLFLYAYLGTLAQSGLRLWRGQPAPPALELGLWLGGLALTIALSLALGPIALRLLAEARALDESAKS